MLPDDNSRLKEKITIEIILIEQELFFLKNIREKIKHKSADGIELRAAASSLHSIYNAYENIFKMIVKYKNISLLINQKWHKSLLDTISPIILDKDLHIELQKLLGFRHFFRHAYSFSLRWENMEPLIISVIDYIHPKLSKRLHDFIEE